MNIVQMYATGLSCRDIAREVGCNEETVRKALIKAGVQRRSKAYKKPRPVPTWDQFFATRSTRHGECILWTSFKDPAGYGRLYARFAPGVSFAHRMSWFLANGPFDLMKRILHTCDTPSCVNPKHLWLGTQADNVADMCRKRRQRSPGLHGEQNPQAKLTAAKVRKMRALRRGGYLISVIAKEFGVSTMTAHRAVTGTSWGHL